MNTLDQLVKETEELGLYDQGLVVKTKKNCRYCKELLHVLNIHNVSYTTEEAEFKAPMVYLNGKLIFEGLPDYKVLMEFIEEYGKNNK